MPFSVIVCNKSDLVVIYDVKAEVCVSSRSFEQKVCEPRYVKSPRLIFI